MVILIQGACTENWMHGSAGGLVRLQNAKVAQASLSTPPVGPANDRFVKETGPLCPQPFAQLPRLWVQDVVAMDAHRGQSFVGRQDRKQQIQRKLFFTKRVGKGMLE